jgi:RNA polymerase sigma factor (sigma-70 family)
MEGQLPPESDGPPASPEQVFEDAYRSCGTAVLGYALRRSATRDDALDVVAETFAIAWRRRADMPGGAGDVRPWLFGVARHCLANASRSARRASRLGDRLADALSGMPLPDPCSLSEGWAEARRVREALAELPPDDRELVTLIAWEGLTPAQVATALGVPAGTVRVRLHRAPAPGCAPSCPTPPTGWRPTVLSDRDLDSRLADAAGVADADLPALPESLLALLVSDTRAPEGASILALRQLIADAHEARTDPRPGRRRRTVLRVGAALVLLAAVWAAVAVTPRTDGGPGPHRDGAPITLVAAEQIAFPVSLDPAPAGLTPLFSQWGGVPPFQDQLLTFTASYRTADGVGFDLVLYADDPRGADDVSWPDDDLADEEPATVRLDGGRAQVVSGGGRADLLWPRRDGQWVRIIGDGPYGDADAVVAVAESVVDRPQPIGLQFGLAPAGWTLNSLEESRSIDLSSDVDPEQRLKLSRYGPGFPITIDSLLEDMTFAQPAETVTLQGQPARLVLAQPGVDAPVYWYVAGSFPDGSLFLLVAPETMTREQVLQIADQVRFTP